MLAISFVRNDIPLEYIFTDPCIGVSGLYDLNRQEVGGFNRILVSMKGGGQY